jgi:hypothetical protein
MTGIQGLEESNLPWKQRMLQVPTAFTSLKLSHYAARIPWLNREKKLRLEINFQ